MEVSIMNYRGACSWVPARDNFFDVIYITNYNKNHDSADAPRVIREGARSHIVLEFDDIDFPLNDYVLPLRHDVERALKYAEGKENILVTCPNGITRSAAIAYVISAKFIGAVKSIKMLTPLQHHPNRRIVALGGEILQDPSVLKVYNNWLKKPTFNFYNVPNNE